MKTSFINIIAIVAVMKHRLSSQSHLFSLCLNWATLLADLRLELGGLQMV